MADASLANQKATHRPTRSRSCATRRRFWPPEEDPGQSQAVTPAVPVEPRLLLPRGGFQFLDQLRQMELRLRPLGVERNRPTERLDRALVRPGGLVCQPELDRRPGLREPGVAPRRAARSRPRSGRAAARRLAVVEARGAGLRRGCERPVELVHGSLEISRLGELRTAFEMILRRRCGSALEVEEILPTLRLLGNAERLSPLSP